MSAATEVQQKTPDASRGQTTAAQTRPDALFHSESVGNTVAVASLVFAAVVLAFLLTQAISWYNRPFVGVLLTDSLTVDSSQPATQTTWAGLNAGLKSGDQIIGVTTQDARLVTFPAQSTNVGAAFDDLLSGLTKGQILNVQIRRPAPIKVYDSACTGFTSAGATCVYAVVLDKMPLLDFLIQFGLGFLVGLLLLAVGVLAYRSIDDRGNARVLTVLCSAMAVVAVGRFDLFSTYQLPVIWLFGTCVGGGALLAFTLTFPYRQPILYTINWVRLLPVIAGIVWFVVVLALYLLPDTRATGIEQNAALLYLLICAIILSASLIVRRRFAPTPIARERAGLGVVGLLVTVLPLLLWALGGVAQSAFGWTWATFPVAYVLPPLLVFPLSMLYSLQQTRLFNSDRALNEGVIYGFLGAVLVIGFVLFTYGLYQLTGGQISWNSPLPVALTLVLISVGFSPARRILERQIDRAFMRQRRGYESRLEKFSRRLTRLTEVHDVVRELHAELMQTTQPEHLLIFVRSLLSGEYQAMPDPATGRPSTDIVFSPGSALLNYLNRQETVLTLSTRQLLPEELIAERARLAVLGSAVIARMHSSSRLNGFIALGARRDQRQYTFEDLRYIEGLADQSALAIERSQVMTEAQRSENELKVLSQISAMLNIAMDYDTLLEFIYAQTDRLLHTPNVYIVLYVPELNELQMSFYQEAGERMADQEGTHWPIGNDLFSEVVRTQLPVRTDRFPVEAEKRNMGKILTNPRLRAWMGVPLNSGSGSVIGAMAVASDQIGFSYSDDQMRLFSSVADLAASALEKARLLGETEQRAQQLAVLNEISSQLASQYENVRALLETITNRAASILRAATGSLLLRDDQSDNLTVTFTVGVGADDMIGKAIPVGSGIAGDVADNQEPRLVNQSIIEMAWPGELPANLVEAGTVRSVLAVPLIGRGGVLGILELINKEDGTQFVENDIKLLTAFASQAAIAIENARLYQMTDEQLAERVEQLNLMQRIDQELNRRLNLQAVTDLTLDNALRESHADAGVLLSIGGDPLQFTVSGSVGFPLSVFEMNATYPIEFGLPGRAYHSRRPLLVNAQSEVSFLGATLPDALEQLAVPMTSVNQEITTILLLESKTPGTFTNDTVAFVTALVEHANTAITNAVLFEQLEHANTARTEFVSFVAHELKNPMTAVKGFVELMIGGMTGAVSDQQKNLLDVMQRNIVRMQQILEDLRDVTALETGQLKVNLRPINFSTVVVETLRTQQRVIDSKEQTLIVEVPDELPTIQGDSNRLIQVLTNFVSNAIKYTPEGGMIRVKTTVEDNLWNPEYGKQVIHCVVIDSGYGMSPEDLKQLGSAYFRSQNPKTIEQPGTGLGMTITYALIHEHHGQVWVESVLDEGTTFHFTLPIVESMQFA